MEEIEKMLRKKLFLKKIFEIFSSLIVSFVYSFLE